MHVIIAEFFFYIHKPDPVKQALAMF